MPILSAFFVAWGLFGGYFGRCLFFTLTTLSIMILYKKMSIFDAKILFNFNTRKCK